MIGFNYIFAYQDPSNPYFRRIFNVGFGDLCVQVYDRVITTTPGAKIAYATAFENAVNATLAELNAQSWDDILAHLDANGLFIEKYVSILFKLTLRIP